MTQENAKQAAELVPLFRAEMEQCRVRQGETILAFTNPLTNPNYTAAIFGAAALLGATPFQITVPLTSRWADSKAIADAWRAADLVIAMTIPANEWIYSDAHNKALEAGARTLMIQEPPDILRRLFPDPAVRARTEAGQKAMAEARSLRITSEAGTSLTLDKGDRPVVAQFGISDAAGRWDHWPSGQVVAAPIEDSAEGMLVIDEGDMLLPLGRFVTAPIRCSIHEGKIAKIEGGADARLLRDLFESADDPNAYVVSHVGWGTEHRAQWNEGATRFWQGGGQMDVESFYGNMLIAFGANSFSGMGGVNQSKVHVDIPTRNHSFWVDELQVLDRGHFVADGLR